MQLRNKYHGHWLIKIKSGINGEDCITAQRIQNSQLEEMISKNFTEEVEHAHEKIFERDIRLKEMVTDGSFQRNGMASDPS